METHRSEACHGLSLNGRSLSYLSGLRKSTQRVLLPPVWLSAGSPLLTLALTGSIVTPEFAMAVTDNIAAKRGAFHEIPIIDLRDAFSEELELRKRVARKIYDACVRCGFFYIKNHGVDEGIMKDIFSAAKEFFALPLQEKMAIDLNQSAHFRGYTKLMVSQRQCMSNNIG